MPYRVVTDVEMPSLACAARRRHVALIHHAEPDAVALLLRWDDGAEPATTFLRDVRQSGWPGPIMLLAISGASAAAIAALDAGADEVVAAGAPVEEIAARLAAMIRRTGATTIRIGDLAIDCLTRRVARAGKPLDLLPREYAILLHLARHAGRCISRPALLRDIWGLPFDPGTNVVQVQMSRLRAKLDRGFETPMLHTEKGKGYRLAPNFAA